jgi:serine/threonine protein phosphatase 1
MVSRIQRDALAHGVSRPQVVFLGDYVDRGPDSRGVLDFLISSELRQGIKAVFLLGNHDFCMLTLWRMIRHDDIDWDLAKMWLETGGADCIESYGVALKRSPGHFLAEWSRAVPQAHIDFLGSMQLSHRVGDWFFSHAGANPDRALDEQTHEDLLFGDSSMFDFDHEYLAPKLRERLGAVLVHGHWCDEETTTPEILPHRINVDTGCSTTKGGYLSAVCLDGDAVRVL